jgi:hypothetical protein
VQFPLDTNINSEIRKRELEPIRQISQHAPDRSRRAPPSSPGGLSFDLRIKTDQQAIGTIRQLPT